MWRSLFLAVGIILIIGGLECMVVGRFFVSPEARIPGFLTKAMGNSSQVQAPSAVPQVAVGTVNRPTIANVAPPQRINNQVGYGGSPSGWSQYGPSRFSDTYNNNQSYLRKGSGMPTQVAAGSFRQQGYMPNAAVRNNVQGGQPFSLSGYGTSLDTSLPLQAAPVSPVTIKPDKILHTKDWMPWSMIAAGVIVVLYTNSLARRNYDS
jgi:hypothetical protein